MSLIELNIYNDDNEIIKTYATKRVRWGVLCKAVELEDKVEGATPAESLKLISDFTMSIFPSMTADDLALADYNDMLNVFKMVVNMTGHIESKNG